VSGIKLGLGLLAGALGLLTGPAGLRAANPEPFNLSFNILSSKRLNMS
jgi:hypothetical protein